MSHQPGRTRHLFRFELGASVTLVDLPGYGFAKTPKKVKESWRELVDGYLSPGSSNSQFLAQIMRNSLSLKLFHQISGPMLIACTALCLWWTPVWA